MQNLGDHQKKTQSVFVSSLEWFANFTAVVITFFGTPLAYDLTAPFVREFTRNHYSHEFVWVADGCWFFIVGGLVFFGARATTATLILSGGIVLAARLWG
ncbi:unnamed protein product [Ectocarpus sp. 8 AP-2014]